MRIPALPGFILLLFLAFVTPAQAGEPPSYFNGFDVDDGLITPRDIDHGGPGRDEMPAIDHPKFLQGAQRDDQIAPESRVLGVSYNGISKAYPIEILDHHEIVNDTFGDTAMTVTFCPLCGTGMVFYAEVDGQLLNFGVSGLIYNSELEVRWDRTASSATVFDSDGMEIPATAAYWFAWVAFHPATGLYLAPVE